MEPVSGNIANDKNVRGGVDALIIYNHGGIEYMDMPLPEWRDVCRMWIDLGADAVIASHPHVPQGYEFYKGKPICYSLGNFCFNKIKDKTPPRWNESLCCIMDINEPHQVNMEVRPIIYDPACGYIKDNPSTEFAEHLQCMNEILQNEDEYMRQVDESVMSLLPHYKGMFSRGGFVTGLFQKDFAKGFVEGLMGRGFWRQEHALNNIQCESHRWATLRALNLKKKNQG